MECILLLRASYLRLFIPITVLLLLSFPVLASRQEQKITLNVSNKTLKNVFHSIEEQTDVLIMYDLAVIDDNEKVSINVKEMVLEEVLNKLFYNKPVKWSKKGNVVRVFIEAPVKEPVNVANASAISIFGKVTDENGVPLVGATVWVKGTNQGTNTNANGEFLFDNIDENSTLTISFLGYTKIDLSIKGKRSIGVQLKPAINALDEAVVQGYGITTRRTTTGNIGRITAAEIEKQPVMNPLLALQGKVAGLNVTQSNGFASAPVKIELRGRGTIGDFAPDPLYVIDGVPLTIVDLYGQSNYGNGSIGYLQNGNSGPAGGQSPLFNINPGDIESIEVLKDADATSIYGSRGANGVILITTKKGKAGKTKFDLHLQQGESRVTRYVKMLNTPQYLEMRKEAFKNNGITPGSNDGYDLLLWDSTKYTNWQKALYGGSGKTTDVQASISGGNNQTNFRLGAAYNHTTNILTVSGADQRASVSLNISHRSLNQRFSISFTNSYALTQSDMINLPGRITYAPNAPAIYDSVGNLNYAEWGGLNTGARRAYPFTSLKQPYNQNTNFLNSNLALGYEIVKGLSINTSFGFNAAQANQKQLYLIASKDPLTNPTGDAYAGYNKNRNWIIEPQISYNRLIGEGNLNILLGGSSQQTNTNGTAIYSYGYASDQLINSLSNAKSQTGQDNSGEYRYAAIFGRINYNWKGKYIVNLSGRRDGSSRFGADKQYGNFGSVGAAWIFTEENWLKEQFSFLSFGKLRASYGTTGSDAVGDYQYLTRWSSSIITIPTYNNIPGVVSTQHTNPNYQWQVNKKFETALNLGFLNDRLSLEAAYYLNRCGNQLVRFPTPIYTGFGYVTANSLALIENSGWEFNANARIIETKNFNWSINFNLAINRNKLVSYPNFELSPYVGQLIVGQPLNISRILHSTGVDPKTGEYTFEDKNKDGEISIEFSGRPDDTYAVNLSPKFFGGFGTDFNFKGFQLSLFFNVKKQIGMNGLPDAPGTLNNNQPLTVLSRWRNPGDISTVARYTTQGNTNDFYHQVYSDAFYTDASFIRLSNLSLSYNVPVSWIKKTGMQAGSLFLHTNNLFVITKYKGIDPETQNFGGLPPAKVIVGGIKFNF